MHGVQRSGTHEVSHVQLPHMLILLILFSLSPSFSVSLFFIYASCKIIHSILLGILRANSCDHGNAIFGGPPLIETGIVLQKEYQRSAVRPEVQVLPKKT